MPPPEWLTPIARRASLIEMGEGRSESGVMMMADDDAKQRACYEALVSYLSGLEAFADGPTGAVLPDHRAITDPRFLLGSMRAARPDGEDRFHLGIPFVAVLVRDDDASPGDDRRSERYIDPWYFASMLLMELPQGRFRFDRSKREGYYYLAYAGPERKDKEGNHYLRRSIMDAPPDADVRQKRRLPEGHYDYRKVTLKLTKKRVIRATGQKTRFHSRTRGYAIRFAAGLFGRCLEARGTQSFPGLDIGAAEYETLLRRAFDLADAVHKKRHPEPGSE